MLFTLSSQLAQLSYSLPTIRRNIFNIVLAVDLTQSGTMNLINSFVNIVTKGLPIRAGIIPIIENEECKLFC